jgi:ABC-type multidrug transport system permease subunit
MLGMVGIFEMYGIESYEIAMDLMLVNIAGWFASSRWNSKDGMRTFHIGLYIALLLIFFFMPWYGTMVNFLLIGAFLSLMTACYGFMMFLIKPLEGNISQYR